MKPKLIIIDDDVSITDSYKIFLSKNFDVSLSTSIVEGKEKFSNNHYDIAIIDLSFPNKPEGGLELCSFIAENCPNTISIIMTAYDSIRLEENSKKLKIFDIITKGTTKTRDQLIASINDALVSLESILIKRITKDIFFDSNTHKPLPFVIKQFYVKHYNGIVDTSFSNIPVDTQWIFLTGKNAFGKTALLQSMALGLHGKLDNRTILAENQKTNIYVELKENFTNKIIHLDSEHLKEFVAYGPSRIEIQSPRTQNQVDHKSSKLYSLFNHDGICLNIAYDMLLWKLEKKPIYDIVIDMLLKLIPQIGKIEFIDDELVFYEKDANDPDLLFDPLPFSQLSVGQRSIIAMIGDIISRFKRYHPEIDNPEHFSGIVIIDELEAHLHPTLQVKLPTLLSDLFPKIQFIASTHSALPFLGAPEKSIFFKVNRDHEHGIWAEPIELIVKELTPNLLLTSPLFDMAHVLHIDQKNILKVRTEDNYKDMEKNDNAQKILKEFEDSDKDYPDDLFNNNVHDE